MSDQTCWVGRFVKDYSKNISNLIAHSFEKPFAFSSIDTVVKPVENVAEMVPHLCGTAKFSQATVSVEEDISSGPMVRTTVEVTDMHFRFLSANNDFTRDFTGRRDLGKEPALPRGLGRFYVYTTFNFCYKEARLSCKHVRFYF